MIAENVKRVGSDASCRYMEYRRKQLARYLIHIGDHEKKTLGSGVCCCECACCEGTVNGSGRAGFGLHLRHLNGCAEDVFLTLRRPLVDIVSHGARRSYGVDTRNLRERIRHIRCSVVAVHAL